MSENKFKIKLEMLSDWQIGTGAGIPGSTDELISKDADGFPQVPAKSLVGIWRDALERLCDGLGGNWSNWVEVIFGIQPNLIDKTELAKRLKNGEKTYSNSILSIQPARISENLRARIDEDRRLKQALTFVKVGVKIDADSGTSETEALRFEEMGRIGTVLDAEVELDWSYFTDEQTEIASALLILSAKLVERIGGKRRRGAGKCLFKVFDSENVEQSVKNAKDKIAANKDEKIKPPKKAEKPDEQTTGDKSEQNDSGWQTCEYTLTLETPVSIVTAVLGNVSETLDFVPGTYLISHFVKHFGQEIFNAIQANNFQISPATICIDGNRSFPVPKVFAQEKMKKINAEKKEVYNRLLESLKEKDQTKPIREGFISGLNSNAVSHAATPQTILMHNAVDDKVQRPTTDVIGIYSREAIKAGTILKGEIRYKGLEIDCQKLNGRVRIGTSKKDGGSAKIEFQRPKLFESKSVAKNNELVVYLASDAMLRNKNLRQTNLAEDLAEALGLKGETIKSQQIQVRRIESWQTSWGFPRPTLTLMQAGSVVCFKTDKTIDFDKIEAEGIGERRGEGYGQIIFNPPVLTEKINDWKHIKKLDFDKCKNLSDEEKQNKKAKIDKEFAEELKKDKSLKDFAEIIEETAWREELKIAVSKIAAEEKLRKEFFGFEIDRKENSKKSIPPMSQIGGLRSAVMRLQSNTSEEKRQSSKIVTDWLTHLKNTQNRFEKWGNERIGKIRKLIDEDIKIWLILCETEIDGIKVWQSPKSLTHKKEDLQKKLWAEAVKSLFYACQHAHKRDTEKPGKEDENNGEEN
ncbi:MAG TPA: RAMP superfamily CRISPR-associated protein [Pyrinomonadaceae bacterium]|jgi:CRISPR-associated protein Csx10